MRKNLIAALVTLGLGAAATAVIVGPGALAQQAPLPGTPMLLAQANAPAPATPAGRRGPGRAMPRPAPTTAQRTARRAERCRDVYARAAGRFAMLEVRLNLTGAQTAAFARWRDQRLGAAKQRAAECVARPLPGAARGATRPSPVERLAREETMLQRRLADIQAERPALDALYGSLDATQRQVLARQRGGFGRGGMGMRGGFGRGGMMRPGMMNRGAGGPNRMPPPNGNPPPPPPQ